MGRPRLLVLDEPTEGIQPSIVKAIEAVIASLKGRMSILLVEQYFDFAQSLADRYVVLNRGAVVAAGAGQDMNKDAISRFLSI
jgi:urea transport system ATP-binding protein